MLSLLVIRAFQLIQYGAKLEPVNNSGWTALHKAVRHGHEAMVDLLLKVDLIHQARGTEETSLEFGVFQCMACIYREFQTALQCPFFVCLYPRVCTLGRMAQSLSRPIHKAGRPTTKQFRLGISE